MMEDKVENPPKDFSFTKDEFSSSSEGDFATPNADPRPQSLGETDSQLFLNQ